MARKKARAAKTATKKVRPSKSAESVYQKRIRLYLAAHPGATKQAARGKPAQEHVQRREREAARLGGLTGYQLHQVEGFAERQAKRMDKSDAREIAARLVTWAQGVGYERFKQYKGHVAALAKMPRDRARGSIQRDGKRVRIELPRRHAAAGIAHMESAFDAFDMPDLGDLDLPDWAWFYYH